MTNIQKRRLMIAVLATIGSILALTIYVDVGISQQDVVQADQQETIESTSK